MTKKTILTISPAEAAAFIKKGGLVAFPTETVYGLGANVFDETAVKKIFEAKQRPADNPLIAHVGDRNQIGLLADEIPPAASQLVDKFFPGPLTVVLRKRGAVPETVTAGLDTIGVRMPGEKITREFLKECGTPVAAPSANISGRPSPTTWEAVLEDLDGRIDCILKGAPARVGLESTVIDCTVHPPVVLRPGAVSLEELREVVPETAASGDIASDAPKSPGMKHKHYSPGAKVIVLDETTPAAESKCAFIGISEPPFECSLVRRCTTADDYAGALFGFFRECDRKGISLIYCEPVSEEGIGAALMDRIRRAAE